MDKEPKVKEVDIATKLTILAGERQSWLNTRELLTLRYRVNLRIHDEEANKQCVKDLEKCEAALDELDKISAELQEPPKQ